MIVIGNRFNDIADRYFDNGKKRPLIADLLRLVETENAKRKKKSSRKTQRTRGQEKGSETQQAMETKGKKKKSSP